MSSQAQINNKIQWEKVSCAEKWWAIKHLFVVKKAKKITTESRKMVEDVKKENLLKGNGYNLQIDAFRHTYWMARLTQEIGERRAKSLGKAHEKGNYQLYKKRKNEAVILPDKVSSEMDLFNNEVGIYLGKKASNFELKELIIEAVLNGKCKIILMDENQHFLDCEGLIIPKEELIGKWENRKCLVNSDYGSVMK
ncbi:MAG: hypothetical protein K0B10_11325 [Vicingaceae bacterium]|nr:hypothetical protein [Vicingaceae bacterium]